MNMTDRLQKGYPVCQKGEKAEMVKFRTITPKACLNCGALAQGAEGVTKRGRHVTATACSCGIRVVDTTMTTMPPVDN